jgi:hypothetical protein
MNYEDYYKQIASVYDPQRQLIQQQMNQLPQQYQAQTSALEQAKINAFRDIANQSSARGAGWSGFRPGEESRYTGATFLPALANLKIQQTSQLTSLQDALNKIGLQQAQEARGYYETQKQREYEAQQAQIQREFQAQQAAMDRSYRSSGSESDALASYLKQFKASQNKDKNGRITGTNFYGPNDAPITAAQYYNAVGNSDDLYNFLKNDADATSKKAAEAFKNSGGVVTPDLQSKYPWIFGGV